MIIEDHDLDSQWKSTPSGTVQRCLANASETGTVEDDNPRLYSLIRSGQKNGGAPEKCTAGTALSDLSGYRRASAQPIASVGNNSVQQAPLRAARVSADTP